MAAIGAPLVESGSKRLSLTVASFSLMALTGLAIGFRAYNGIVKRKAFLEDVFMYVGTCFAFAVSICELQGAYDGSGKDYDHKEADILVTLTYAITFFYIGSAVFVKLSFLSLYLRLDGRSATRLGAYLLIFIVLTQNFVAMILLSVIWSSTGHTWNDLAGRTAVQNFFNANGVIIVLSSTAIYVFPFLMMRGINMPRRQKAGVVGLFALGFLSVIATCIKTSYTWRILEGADLIDRLVDAGIWLQVEIHLAIICASAQIFRVLLKEVFPNCCREQDAEPSFPSSSRLPNAPAPTPDVHSPGTPSETQDPRSRPPIYPLNSWHNWQVTTAPLPIACSRPNGRSPSPTVAELKAQYKTTTRLDARSPSPCFADIPLQSNITTVSRAKQRDSDARESEVWRWSAQRERPQKMC